MLYFYKSKEIDLLSNHCYDRDVAIDSGDTENPKVYDPTLGKERDAFPEEITAPEQQSTLQRLMAAEDAKYQALVNAVSPSGQFSPDELNVILRAGKVASEAKRLEYLEAARSNPANIIQGIFKTLGVQENFGVKIALEKLDFRIAELTESVRQGRLASQLRGAKMGSTADYIGPKTRGDTLSSILLNYAPPPVDKLNKPDLFFKLLQELGVIPNLEINNLEELFTTLPRKNGKQSNITTPYATFENGYTIYNLDSNRPGLEGIYCEVILGSNYQGSQNSLQKVPKQLYILGDTDAFVRIVDRGQYTPFNPNTR